LRGEMHSLFDVEAVFCGKLCRLRRQHGLSYDEAPR
jgi:hypothetical protein